MENSAGLKYCPKCTSATHPRAPLCPGCGFSYHLHLELETEDPPLKINDIAANDSENEAPSPDIPNISDIPNIPNIPNTGRR
jgi:hypothetical protein